MTFLVKYKGFWGESRFKIHWKYLESFEEAAEFIRTKRKNKRFKHFELFQQLDYELHTIPVILEVPNSTKASDWRK